MRSEEARFSAVVAAAYSAGVLAVYGAILPAPVFLDDLSYVLKQGVFELPWRNFAAGLFSPGYFAFTTERTYQPLVTLFHYFLHEPAWAYRLAGLGLHALASFAVYLAARRFAGRLEAALAGALFLVFPTHTEALAVSAYKGHIMAAACCVAAWLCWDRAASARKPAPWLAASWSCLVVGLLSKETGLAALLLIAADIAILRPGRRARLLAAALPHAAAAGLYLLVRFAWLVPPGPLDIAAPRQPYLALGWYLGSILWPFPLCMVRSLKPGPALYLLPAAAAALAWLRRRDPATLFGLAWTVAALAPFLHVVAFAHYNPVADRYLYLAAAGPCLALAAHLRGMKGRLVFYAVAVVWAGSSAARSGAYRQPEAFCDQTVACAPENAFSHYLRGCYRLLAEDFPGAAYDLDRARALSPRDAGVLRYLGLARLGLRQYAGAEDVLREASALAPRDARIRNDLGTALLELGRLRQAAEEFDAAVSLDPAWPPPYLNAAKAWGNLDRKRAESARRSYEELLERYRAIWKSPAGTRP
ncbi:MAG: tetratricopeptide repeat protein [Elusimicrobia bacterium]|nr:tetratricopeptide repeat protein [Elusimicrobiota bacterium]